MYSERNKEAGEKTEQESKKTIVQVTVVVVIVLYKRSRLKVDVVALAQETHNKVNYNQLTGLVEP